MRLTKTGMYTNLCGAFDIHESMLKDNISATRIQFNYRRHYLLTRGEMNDIKANEFGSIFLNLATWIESCFSKCVIQVIRWV